MNFDINLPSGARPDAPEWLEHLDAAYQREYSLLTLAVSIGGVGGGVVATLLLKLPQVCKVGSNASNGCVHPSQLLILPLAPTLIILFFGYLFLNARIVGKYARNLERIISSGSQPHQGNSRLTLPALARLEGAMYGGEVRRLMPLRIYYVTLASSIIAISVFTVARLLLLIPSGPLKTLGILFYSSVGVLTIVCYRVGAAHKTFPVIVASAQRRDLLKRRSKQARPSQEPLLGFLGFVLFPRILSLAKSTDYWVAIGVVALINWGTYPVHLRDVTIGWVLFEILLYQTRYLLNLLREEQGARETLPSDRRNLPDRPMSDGQIRAATVIAVVRIGAFPLLLERFTDISMSASLVIVALFVVSYLMYEVPREHARDRMKGLIKSGAETLPPTFPREGRRLFLAVGLGYALRVGVAIYFFSPPILFSMAGVCLVAAAWATGCAQVACGWAIEFKGALTRGSDLWDRNVVHRGVVGKPGLIWAARHASLLPHRPTLGAFPREESQENEEINLAEHSSPRSSPRYRSALLAVALVGGCFLFLQFSWLRLGLAVTSIVIAAVASRFPTLPTLPLLASIATLCLAAGLTLQWNLAVAVFIAMVIAILKVQVSGTQRLSVLVDNAMIFRSRVFAACTAVLVGVPAGARWAFVIVFGENVVAKFWSATGPIDVADLSAE